MPKPMGLEAILHDMWQEVTLHTGELLGADRTTIFLFDEEKNELWSVVAGEGNAQEIRIPADRGIAGEVVTSKHLVNIPFDFYDDPRSAAAQEVDKSTGYRTYTVLAWPLLSEQGELLAVVQLLNKLKPSDDPDAPLSEKFDLRGFTPEDETSLDEFAHSMRRSLLRCQSLYAELQQQHSAAAPIATSDRPEQIHWDILRTISHGIISTDKAGKIIFANESVKQLLGAISDDRLLGRSLGEVIRIKEGDFAQWFEAAKTSTDAKAGEHYYPDRTLIAASRHERNVNLSIKAIADATDPNSVTGYLVVIDEISATQRIKETLSRYVTPELAEQVVESGAPLFGGELSGADALRDDRKQVSLLFSGIRSFTRMLDNLDDREVILLLREYFESMTDAVFKYNGAIDKYIGDVIMAVFGSPVPLEDHAWSAVQTAIEMRQRLAELNPHRLAAHKQAIRIGIGINSDTVIACNVGSSKRMDFTAIGEGVNVASQMERASKVYGCDIILSENTYQLCADRIWTRELDRIRVKGKTQPVRIYEVVGLREEPIDAEQLQLMEYYQEGREHYLNCEFAKAIADFAQVMEIDSSNKAAALHIDRCQHFLQDPPPDDWDGGWAIAGL